MDTITCNRVAFAKDDHETETQSSAKTIAMLREQLLEIAADTPWPDTPPCLPDWLFQPGTLASMSEDQIVEATQVSILGARRIKAAYRLHEQLLAQRPRPIVIKTAQDVATLMQPLVQRECESIWVLPLTASQSLVNRPVEISRGDVDGCQMEVRSICRWVLRSGATRFFLVHNHPGGGCTPSANDAAVTKRLVTAARMLELDLIDHVIVNAHGQGHGIRSTHFELWR